MINNSLKNKKLIICYEDRDKFKKYIQNNIADSWSKFLISPQSVNSIKKFLSNRHLHTELLEINDIQSFKNILNLNETSNLLLWNISDGCDIFKGSYIPSFAKLLNIKFYGSETYAQYIAQDKFKFISICEKLNISVPLSLLYSYDQKKYFPKNPNKIFNNKQILFIKPNIFDNNIGIKDNAKINISKLLKNITEISNDIKSDILIQEYIDGFDLRICYVGNNQNIKNKIGIFKIEKYDIRTGKKVDFINEVEAKYIDFRICTYTNKNICKSITDDVIKLIKSLKLKDYFAFDVRVTYNESKYYFIELNTAPFIINKTMDTYAKVIYNQKIVEVFYDSITHAF